MKRTEHEHKDEEDQADHGQQSDQPKAEKKPPQSVEERLAAVEAQLDAWRPRLAALIGADKAPESADANTA